MTRTRQKIITVTSEYDAKQMLTRDLADAKATDSDVVVDHSCEGGVFMRQSIEDYYTQRQIDIFSVLHAHCNEAGYDPSRLTLRFGNTNMKELYQEWCSRYYPDKQINVEYVPRWLDVAMHNYLDMYSYSTEEPDKIRDKIFTFFNGYERNHRVKAFNWLDDNNLLDQCEWTWVNNAECDTFGDVYLNESLLPLIPKSAEGHTDFHDKSTSSCPGQTFYKMYEDTYFDVIAETLYHNDSMQCETYNWWNTVFFSEKVWRSIKFKRPFLLIGNRNSLSELHRLGFKTFPSMFDESYDSLDDNNRLSHVLNQLKGLTNEEVHKKFYSEDVQNAIEHNYKHANYILANEK